MKIIQQPDGTWAIVDENGQVISKFASRELALREPVNVVQQGDGWATVNAEGTVVQGGYPSQSTAFNTTFPSIGLGNAHDAAEATAQARIGELLTKLNVKPPQSVKTELRARVSAMIKDADEAEVDNILESLDDKALTNLYVTSARTVATKQTSALKQNFNEAYGVVTASLKADYDSQTSMTERAAISMLIDDLATGKQRVYDDFVEFYFQNKPAHDDSYSQNLAAADFLQTWLPPRARSAAQEGAGIGQQVTYEKAMDNVQARANVYAQIAQLAQRNVDQMKMDLNRMTAGLKTRPELSPVLEAVDAEVASILTDYAAVASKQLPQDYLNTELPRRLQFSLAGEMGALNSANIVQGDAMATIANLTKGFGTQQKDQFGNTVAGAPTGRIAPPNQTAVDIDATEPITISGGPKPGVDPAFDEQVKALRAYEVTKTQQMQQKAQASGAANQSYAGLADALGLPQESLSGIVGANMQYLQTSPIYQNLTPAQQEQVQGAYSQGNIGEVTNLLNRFNPSKAPSAGKAAELAASPVAGAIAFQAPQNQAAVGAAAQGNVNADLVGAQFAFAEQLGIDRAALEARLKPRATTYATDDDGGVGYNYAGVDPFQDIIDLTPDEDVRTQLKSIYKPGQVFNANDYRSLASQVPKFDPVAYQQQTKAKQIAKAKSIPKTAKV